MKGYKTLAFNLLWPLITVGLPVLADFNWGGYLPPTAAMLIQSAVNMALRMVTTTAVGQKL